MSSRHQASAEDAIARVLGGLGAQLGELAGSDLAAMSAQERASVLRACGTLTAQVDALRLAVLAAADAGRDADAVGASGTDALDVSLTRVDAPRAARDLALARDLRAGRAATSAALREGAISTEHAQVIAVALRRLSDRLDGVQLRLVEQHLLSRAVQMTPSALRRVARRAVEAVEPDRRVVDAEENAQVASEEERALGASRLTMHDNADGTVTGHFTVPRLAGDVLRRVVQAMTAPRRAALGATSPHAGDGRSRPGAVSYDAAHHRGLAFVELLEHLPTDHLHRRVAATVVVHLDLDRLRGELAVATADSGSVLSAGEARRLACDAGIVPAVLGGASLPLDLGRERRLFTESQAVALSTRHDTCAARGCERPFAWCELHHRRPWSRGGRTDLRDAVPLCAFHHRRVHDPKFESIFRGDGAVELRRRT